LTSLTYNAGPKWMRQGLGTALKQGNFDLASDKLLEYNKAGGVLNSGLADRRLQEQIMFNSRDNAATSGLNATIPQSTLDQLRSQTTPDQFTSTLTSPFGNITNPGQQLSQLQLPGLDQIQSQLASAGGSITSYASSVATSGSSALSATGGINQLISSLGSMGSGGGGLGGLGSLFGGFGSGGFGGGFGGGFDDFGVAHGGGLIGFTALNTRSFHSSIFNGAPRFHGGLMDDEFPAVLQRGERVLTAGDNARMTRTIDMLAANAGTSATNQGFMPGNGGAPRAPISIAYHVSTPDRAGFDRNQDQINSRASVAMRRAVERNN
jgi:hypothetical protein